MVETGSFQDKVLDGVIGFADRVKRKGWRGALDEVVQELLPKPERDERAAVLEGFVQQVYWAENLATDQSKKNLEEGVVEIIEQGQHVANGLLISDNGYFLTNKHCLTGDQSKRRIRAHDGRTYGIEKVCAIVGRDMTQGQDIGLAKATMYGSKAPKQYKIYLTKNGKEHPSNLPLALMTRRNGKLVYKYGFTRGEANLFVADPHKGVIHCEDTTWSSIRGIPGDSGGSLVTADGRLYGLLMAGNAEGGAGVTIDKALSLIVKYTQRLKR